MKNETKFFQVTSETLRIKQYIKQKIENIKNKTSLLSDRN